MRLIDNFVYFIKERESVRILKDGGAPKPWTDDQYLREWRFCNVDRCQDRETKWIFKNIIGKHPESPWVWFNLAIARFINWSPTLELMGYFDEWSAAKFCDAIQIVQERGEKAYTGAYMIRGGTGEDAKVPKHTYLANRVFTPLWNRRFQSPEAIRDGGTFSPRPTCYDWSEYLRETFGMGDFMRNQIITDMKYSRHLPKAKTDDWTTFCLAGPGTRRGLNRLMGQPLLAPIKDPTTLLLHLRSVVRHQITGFFQYDVFEDLNNLSNCCCEFDKYRRLVEGTGEPRSRYHSK